MEGKEDDDGTLKLLALDKRRVLETIEELLPPRLKLALQAAVLCSLTQVAVMVVSQVAVLVVPKAVGHVAVMLTSGRNSRLRR